MFKNVTIRTAKKAQSLVEYGLILALVSVIAIAALQMMGGSINKSVTSAGQQLESSSSNSAAAYCTSMGGTFNATTKVCTPAS